MIKIILTLNAFENRIFKNENIISVKFHALIFKRNLLNNLKLNNYNV